MVIGFNPEFVEPILKGSKIHTIREDVHNRWREGLKMHMATGVRTKKYNCFNEKKCTQTQTIKIEYRRIHNPNDTVVYIDGTCVGTYTNGYASGLIRNLAKNDGFKSVKDFFDWFNSDYEGKIIHWTDFKY